MSYEDPSLTSDHLSSVLTLTEHGRGSFKPADSRYSCHTGTIPLSTTLDGNYLLKNREDSVTSFHGHRAGEGASPHCPKMRCMFTSSDNARKSGRLLPNCPCMSVRTPEGTTLQPICFLTYLKALNVQLVNRLDDYDQGINPAEIMFCHDSNGVMDNSYPGSLRDKIGVNAWGHVSSPTVLFKLLDCLYWYRKYSRKYKTERIIRSFIDLRGIAETKRVMSQVFHTLNGLLIKKFMAFGPEIVGYRDLADQTARLFRDLFSDYILPVNNIGGVYNEQESCFVEIKALLNTCKQAFHKPSKSQRVSWLETKFTSRAIGSFFGTEFRRLINTINRYNSSENEDYTESLAWVFRCTTFCQTRVLGYLPLHVAEVKRHVYRQTVNRPVEKIPKEQCEMIYLAVMNHLDKGDIPAGLFTLNQPEAIALIDEAIRNVSVEIKQNASTDHTVSEGGKIEDARLLVKVMRENAWKVPVRDLDNHKIINYIDIPTHDQEVESWSRPLFWASYQIVLNFWIKHGKWDRADYYRLPLGEGEYEEDILLAKILHISEPGKERNLTKSKATYAWFLTPAGKLCQAVLANLPEHRAGLELSSHDWMHTRRISGESEESGFIYNPVTGKLQDNIVHAFKDWTESTDFIGKWVGVTHLRALMDFTAFPRKYKDLVLRLIMAPQPVEEVILRKVGGFISGDVAENQIVPWKGAIREGFMMGNPITKSILHLIHVSELETVTHYLQRLGIVMRRGYPLTEVLHRTKLPRATKDGALKRDWRTPVPFMAMRSYIAHRPSN